MLTVADRGEGGGGGKICQNLADVICERSLIPKRIPQKVPAISASYAAQPTPPPSFFPTFPSGNFGISTRNHFLMGYNTLYNGNIFRFYAVLSKHGLESWNWK